MKTTAVTAMIGLFLVFAIWLLMRSGQPTSTSQASVQTDQENNAEAAKLSNITKTTSSDNGPNAQESLDKQIQNQAEQVKSFEDDIARIRTVELKPEFAPWKADLSVFVDDAITIFSQTSAIKETCFVKKIASSGTCDSATVREDMLRGNMLALSGFVDENQMRPWDNKKIIAPQVTEWEESGFTKAKLEVTHYATSMDHFDLTIAKAVMLKNKASESVAVGDWTDGLILLRHSQMLMSDASTRALREAYSR